MTKVTQSYAAAEPFLDTLGYWLLRIPCEFEMVSCWSTFTSHDWKDTLSYFNSEETHERTKSADGGQKQLGCIL